MPYITKTDLCKIFSTTKNIAIAATDNELIPAAVLVPIIDDAELTVLFTQRNLDLRDHAGQISFPGGRMEVSDATLEQTALRESIEEVGLAQDQIQILGQMAPLVSSANFLVTPFVGLIQPPLKLIIDPLEVAEVFSAPLDFLLDPINQQRGVYLRDGKTIDIYFIEYQNHRIWGLTARILVEISHQLRAVQKI